MLLVLLMLPLGDTPRWYLKAGRREDARRELTRIETGDPDAALAELEQDVEEEGAAASWGEVFSKRWRAPLTIGIGLAVFQQINEIFPRGVRGRAVSVATAVNWFSAWLVSQFFLTLVDGIGESATFWLFALMCVLCLVWIIRKVPETKGRTLEEIEQMWVDAGQQGGRSDVWDRAESSSS